MLDLDKLAEAEDENWVWKGSDVLRPTYDRALIFLSRGGGDAVVVREFDLETKELVPGGFFLPEAKTNATWRNRDASTWEPTSVRGHSRGRDTRASSRNGSRYSSLNEASTVFEGQTEDVSVNAAVIHDHGRIYELIWQRKTFFTNQVYIRRGDEWVEDR